MVKARAHRLEGPWFDSQNYRGQAINARVFLFTKQHELVPASMPHQCHGVSLMGEHLVATMAECYPEICSEKLIL